MRGKIKVAYVVNAPRESGVGSRAFEIKKRLVNSVRGFELDEFYLDGENVRILKNGEEVVHLRPWPGFLGSKSIGWIRLGWVLKQILGGYDLVHLTNQTLSFMAGGNVLSVVTVHDIIEVVEPQERVAYLINRYLYGGIKRASYIIAVSEYTSRTVREHYKIPAERITVIHNGVSSEFHQIDNFTQTVAYNTLRQELRIQEGQRVILYVGSDHPRKNVAGAVAVFAVAREKLGKNILFVKVGEPGIAAGRRMLLEEMDRLEVRDAVRLVGRVSQDRLNELYNLADALIFPSRFEGFGLPVLQAMAVGTVVVTSNATSLPEVVGKAAIMHDSDDIEGMAESLVRVLTDKDFADKMVTAGLERVKMFSWEGVAEEEIRVYEKVAGDGDKLKNKSEV